MKMWWNVLSTQIQLRQAETHLTTVLSILHSFFPQHGSISKEQPVDYWLAEGLLLNDCLKGDQIKLRMINLFRSQYGIHDVYHLNLDSLKTPMFLGITICVWHVLNKLNKTLAKSTYRLNLKYCREMQSIKISNLNHLVHLVNMSNPDNRSDIHS